MLPMRYLSPRYWRCAGVRGRLSGGLVTAEQPSRGPQSRALARKAGPGLGQHNQYFDVHHNRLGRDRPTLSTHQDTEHSTGRRAPRRFAHAI
jgi:hypothetical protein